jgi:Fe-S cluster assembly protein SufD
MSTAVLEKIWWQAAFAHASDTPVWLKDLQQVCRETFLARGLPTRKDERWKYTNVAFLQNQSLVAARLPDYSAFTAAIQSRRLQADSIFIVLINGHYVAALSDTTLLPDGVTLCSVRQARDDLVESGLQQSLQALHTVFTPLNIALLQDGVFLQVPDRQKITVPVHILYFNAGQNAMVSSPRNVIIAGDNSSVTILEEHAALQAENYFTNIASTIHAEKNAQVNYHKIQQDAATATHIAAMTVTQLRDSHVNICGLALGGLLARDDIVVSLNEPGAQSSVNGFYVLQHDGQHIDNHIQIDHVAAHGTSDMMYKGILDKKSRAVFNGKILVHKNAQKTRSQQANHNLLLSPDAMVDTKPELEIYNDDVKCAHADTVGQLDRAALFYLQSRGIDQPTALKILSYAYAADVMNRVTHPAILRHMQGLLNKLLGETSDET